MDEMKREILKEFFRLKRVEIWHVLTEVWKIIKSFGWIAVGFLLLWLKVLYPLVDQIDGNTQDFDVDDFWISFWISIFIAAIIALPSSLVYGWLKSNYKQAEKNVKARRKKIKKLTSKGQMIK